MLKRIQSVEKSALFEVGRWGLGILAAVGFCLAGNIDSVPGLFSLQAAVLQMDEDDNEDEDIFETDVPETENLGTEETSADETSTDETSGSVVDDDPFASLDEETADETSTDETDNSVVDDDPFASADDPSESSSSENNSNNNLRNNTLSGAKTPDKADTDNLGTAGRGSLPDFGSEGLASDTNEIYLDANGNPVIVRLQDKNPAEMSEDELMKTLTLTEKSILFVPPTTGDELFYAAARIAQLGRKELAKIYFEKSIQAKGTPEAYAKIVEKLGPPTVHRFIADSYYGDVGTNAAQKVLDQARKYWESDAVLQTAFERLFWPNRTQKQKIDDLVTIRHAGDTGIFFLINKLMSDKKNETEMAQALLQQIGEHASNALIQVLFNTTDTELSVLIIDVLDQEEKWTTTALFSLMLFYCQKKYAPGLDAADNSALLERLEAYFVKHRGSVPTLEESVKLLRQEADDYYTAKKTFPSTFDQTIQLWRWNPQTQKPEFQTFSVDVACRLLTEEKNWDVCEIEYLKNAQQTLEPKTSVSSENGLPELTAEKRLLSVNEKRALISSLEKYVFDQEIDASIDLDVIQQYCSEQRKGIDFPFDKINLEDLLKTALEDRKFKAARVFAVALGKWGSESMLSDWNVQLKGTFHPLVLAARSTDPRLRFAAVKTIVEKCPKVNFAGSSLVVETLLHFTTSMGVKKAVVVYPKMSRAMELANTIQDGDFLSIPATTGNAAQREINACFDVEFVLVYANVSQPTLLPFIQNLRSDYRSAGLPVVIGFEHRDPQESEQMKQFRETLSDADRERLQPVESQEAIAKYESLGDPLSFVAILPFDDVSGAYTLLRAKKELKTEIVPASVRRAQALESVQMLSKMTAQNPVLKDIPDFENQILRFLSEPMFVESGLTLAEQFKSQTIQRQLTDMIGSDFYSMPVRRAALLSFQKHLTSFGLLLRGPDIVACYDRYNASETESVEIQRLLGQMLDLIEQFRKDNK